MTESWTKFCGKITPQILYYHSDVEVLAVSSLHNHLISKTSLLEGKLCRTVICISEF
jgi:hypothetical protein